MKSEVENLDPTKIKMTVTVEYEELKPYMDRAYKEVAQQVSIPGFRKGKVPARIIDQRVGRAYVIEHAVNEAMQPFYSQALQESGRMPLKQPEVDVTEIPNATGEPGGQLVFVTEVTVAPEFDLPDLTDLELQVDPIEVSVDDVEAELDTLRQRFASLKTVERPAQKGDFCTIDLLAEVDGKEIDSASGISHEVGSGSLLPGTDEAITGLSADEKKTFTTTLAGGEHAGEEAEVTITVTKVKERELPEADDDFAQLVSDKDTIGELRQDLREQVSKQKAGEQAVQARDKLMDYLRDNVNIDLPQDLVEEQIERRTDDKTTESELADVRKQVEDSFRDELLLEKVSEVRQVQVSQAELLDYVIQTSQMYGMDPSALLGGDQGQLAAIMSEMTRTKALVSCLRDVKVTDTEGVEVDLSEFTKDRFAEEQAQAEAVAEEVEAAEAEDEA